MAVANYVYQQKSFKILFIPADDNEPLAEWDVDIPAGKKIECLSDRLRTHFAETFDVSNNEYAVGKRYV